MYFSASNRALTRTLMAGALVLAGTTACSRPDRGESGGDTGAAVIQDTMTPPAVGQGTATGTDTTNMRDTGATVGIDTTSGTGTTMTGTAAGDTAPARIQSDAPRAATASPSAEGQDTLEQGDTVSAGYRAMERDTAVVPAETDSARVTEDTSETSQIIPDTVTGFADTVSAEMAAGDTAAAEMVAEADTVATGIAGAADTASAGYVEMARDTSGIADQIDTTAGAVADTAGAIQAQLDTAQTETEVAVADTGAAISVGVADTTYNDGRIRPPEDSAEVGGQVNTATDTVAVSADAAVGARGADTTENAGRIRPPEDSTSVTADVNAADTADEAPVAAEQAPVGENAADTDVNRSQDVAASETGTDNVGAAAVGGTVTGAEAVAMMSRQGISCRVVDPDSDEEVRWDMSSTPVTLNPCGLGSMNLSKIWTER